MTADDRIESPLHGDELAALAPALTSVLLEAGFTPDGIAGHLGPDATDALYRGEPAIIRAALSGDDGDLSALIRMVWLRDPTAVTTATRVFGDTLTNGLKQAGALREIDGELSLVLDIRPHILGGEIRYIFSDADASMQVHVPGPEHVLGVGAASLSLLRAVPQTPVDSVLDLGTGSGVQALAQAPSARHIVATDLHPRAIELASASVAGAHLDERIDLRVGSWFEPVKGERFDRIVSNPPFVVGLPEVGHIYRDSGLDLDGATARVAGDALQYLTDGGQAFLLGSWIHTAEQSWQSRVASWLPTSGVSAWILERDIADPALYVSTWLRDESVDLRSREAQERTSAWLQHIAQAGVTGVGFGVIALEAIGDQPSEVLCEEIAQPFTDPLGPEIAEYFRRAEWLRCHDAEEILDSQYALRAQTAREHVSLPDTDSGMGFSPAALRLTRTDGPHFSHEVDEHLASVIAGLHPGGLDLRETLELYSAASDLDAEQLASEIPGLMADLIRHGLILPAELLEP